MSKEVIVPFRCTEEEKEALTQKAVKENGLTVSEYIKDRVFCSDKDENSGDLSIIEEDSLRAEIDEHREISDNLRKENKSLQKIVSNIKSKRNTVLISDRHLESIEDFLDDTSPSRINGTNLEKDTVRSLTKETFTAACIEYFFQSISTKAKDPLSNLFTKAARGDF